MCGITGIFAFNLVGKFNKIHVTAATMALERRGPDYQDIHLDEWIALGHRRLCIIDTSAAAHQPFWDNSKRYCIVFNGEIFNYRELRQDLTNKGYQFRSGSDTEVLLSLYLDEGEKCLDRLNGFFSFCVYDRAEQSLFLARDRFGVKPLLYLFDDDKFIFSSEMKSIIQYGITRDIDYESLQLYLQLNYIPAPDTIFKSVKKLLPGHYLKVRHQKMEVKRWYEIPFDKNNSEQPVDYQQAQETLRDLLEASVKRRLVSDVPLGAFLSGGIDSSVIAGLAAKHKPDLHTFSIGFRDEKFFDETDYARLVAKHFNTQHTVFSLSNDDLYTHVRSILDALDEPFADSSAINVYILSRETRKHATVALSGDGADELLGGYNKHVAMNRLLAPGLADQLVKAGLPLLRMLPSSRNNFVTNKVRQLTRFAEGASLLARDRYWRWASYADAPQAISLLSPEVKAQISNERLNQMRAALLAPISDSPVLNELLLADMKIVLPNDMLTKVDLMSMAHGLEVRTPFLDYELVNFCFSLPSSFKVAGSMRKRILQDAFRNFLPPKLYNRPKKGFEVPLLKWFRREMKSMIVDDLLSEKNIRDQQIFEYSSIEKLKKQLFSNNPGDAPARIWGLIVFQWWWRKNMTTSTIKS